MSYKTKNVSLPERLSRGGDVQFLQAVVFETPCLPLAIVNYSVRGRTEEYGLRLDLDKQVFLDHFPDAESEAIASAAAPAIVDFLGTRSEGAPLAYRAGFGG